MEQYIRPKCENQGVPYQAMSVQNICGSYQFFFQDSLNLFSWKTYLFENDLRKEFGFIFLEN